jgi:hypothetical protein
VPVISRVAHLRGVHVPAMCASECQGEGKGTFLRTRPV